MMSVHGFCRACRATCFALLVYGPLTWSAEIVLIRQIVPPGGGGDGQATVDRFASAVRGCLDAVGLDSATLSSTDVTPDALAAYRIAVLPHNPRIADDTVAALEGFVADGGKLFVFYTSHARVLKLLGVGGVMYRGGADLPKLAAMRFQRQLVDGLPAEMMQHSWNVNQPTPAAEKGAKVLATWLDEDGVDTGMAAATIHEHGVFFSHVYLNEAPAAGERLMLALTGQFLEGVWQRAVAARIEAVGSYRGFDSLDDFRDAMASSTAPVAVEAVRAMDVALTRVEQLRKAQKWSDAFDLAGEAMTQGERAFLHSRKSRDGELRGAWIHSAYGVADWGWDRSIKALADNGFNAIFVNMCWGAVADYESAVLPVHPDVATKGDQIKACLAACRTYGIELHVWKVNWNMGHRTPAAIQQKMKDDGRTQVGLDGSLSRYLAPHLDANFELERDAMLELVRKYPVDGIHFDYIRYPGGDCDFSASARTSFEQWLGRPAEGWPQSCYKGALRKKYNEWRRGNVTRLVRAVYEGAHKIRDDIKVSAAVFGNWDTAPETVAQATEEWIAGGWLDFVCPMNYFTENAGLARVMRRQIPGVNGRIPHYAGLGTWRHPNAARSAEQIDMAREMGSDGFVCFALMPSFVESILPGLAVGATSAKVSSVPHDSISAVFSVSPGDAELEGAYRTGKALQFRAQFPDSVDRLRGVEVFALRDGYVESAGRRLEMTARGQVVDVELRADVPGSYRIELRGVWQTRRERDGQRFMVRGPTVSILGRDEVKRLELRSGPPEFVGNGGVKVGIWADDAYGAEPLITALANSRGVDVGKLYNLKRASLDACDVVVLCQPRSRADLFRDPATMGPVTDFLQAGGGVMTMHALVGIRDFIALAPMVASGEDAVEGSGWQVKLATHPLAAGFSRRDVYTSTFVDRIALNVGRHGRTVMTTEAGAPVVAAGLSRRGRYVACGLGIGIGPGDRDVPPSESELLLVRNAIAWLAKK